MTNIPYQEIKINRHPHQITTYSYGTSKETILLLHGGPGLPSDYLRYPHIRLAADNFRVVTYDQLGCGKSDKPQDKSWWCLDAYVQEVELVRKTLELEHIHLYGQSWGAVLAIEYALTYPDNIKTLTLANGVADIPFHISEINRLRNFLGNEIVAMMLKHEAEGTFHHPEYQAAITLLNYRHLCRLEQWPDALTQSLRQCNTTIYNTMQGPNEFFFTGNLKDWSRLDDLHKLDCHTLIISGAYDMLTPASALRMHKACKKSTIKILKNSSHMPFYEEPEQYFDILLNFLKNDSRAFQ